ncbi:hypothetical protein LTR98_011634 [Exophiala xenobiotica]|nr:hypothetical protein LTR98_011634 [Exophiala xenobiotica]
MGEGLNVPLQMSTYEVPPTLAVSVALNPNFLVTSILLVLDDADSLFTSLMKRSLEVIDEETFGAPMVGIKCCAMGRE